MISREEYELLTNDGVDPNQEFALPEIREKLKEISEKPTPSKPRLGKKQTIAKWFMEGKVLDEDYILLKKSGVDVEKEEITLAKVNNLINKYDTSS